MQVCSSCSPHAAQETRATLCISHPRLHPAVPHSSGGPRACLPPLEREGGPEERGALRHLLVITEVGPPSCVITVPFAEGSALLLLLLRRGALTLRLGLLPCREPPPPPVFLPGQRGGPRSPALAGCCCCCSGGAHLLLLPLLLLLLVCDDQVIIGADDGPAGSGHGLRAAVGVRQRHYPAAAAAVEGEGHEQ